MYSSVLTRTCCGTPVYVYEGGSGSRRVLLCAAHHGSEWITACLLRRFLGEFERDCSLFSTAHLWAVPCVNPDGCAISLRDPDRRTWKANARGVDLNLNYPAGWARAAAIKGVHAPAPRDYPGTHPLSEPETRAMAELAVLAAPDIMVTLHAQGEEIYWNYGGIDLPEAHALGTVMAQRSGYRLCSPPPASSYAGYKDWFIEKFRRPAFTVECGSGENPLPLSDFRAIYARVRPILETALRGV